MTKEVFTAIVSRRFICLFFANEECFKEANNHVHYILYQLLSTDAFCFFFDDDECFNKDCQQMPYVCACAPRCLADSAAVGSRSWRFVCEL